MVTYGRYTDKKGTVQAIVDHKKREVEVILVENGQVCSAYKSDGDNEYSFLNKRAKDLWDITNRGLRGATAKNRNPIPFVKGTATRHTLTRAKIEYFIDTFNGELCGAFINGEDIEIYLEYTDQEKLIPKDIPYIKLTKASKDFELGDEDDVPIRSIQEIALEKEDISWLKNKKYYIINDDEQAEKIFSYLDNYNGVIAYDTETTGLKINCFSKVNSSYEKELEKWNRENPDNQIRADRLVGIIFCVEPNVSYYFPCYNRKFKNLYEDLDSPVRKRIIKNIKSRYTIGDFHNRVGDMADYVRNTPEDEFRLDVILMERVRDILETKHIVAHNGSFEWKTGWIFEIDTNLRDDTMILHQIMYKFRSTTSNRGEPSRLDYLAKRELGIEQWELKDFFPDFKEDKTGTVRNKGNKRNIDFSYMDYEGARIYAPTDGDVTYQLFMKYKKDLVEKHKEQEYIYNVEVIVACAVAYMEFYGHRIDEEEIKSVRDKTMAQMTLIESELRQEVGYSDNVEIACYDELKDLVEKMRGKRGHTQEERDALMACVGRLQEAIEQNVDNVLNLASPAQVSRLFYDELKIPFSGKKSVDKKALQGLLKEKNEDGTNKYPVVHMYSEYKKLDTLMTKFFDNLPNFMYPGGYIFSSYGQINTATGRMSCSKPNAQQYPSEITEVVIPRPGFVMLDADYSQIEYRVLVAMSGEEKLAELFEDPDNDYHTLMASMMYDVPYAAVTPKMRNDAKSFNFGIPYGMGFRSLAILLTGMSGPAQIAEAKEKYELYFKDQPKTRKFFNQVKEMAQVNNYTKTFWNRYRYYSFRDKDGNINEARKAMALRQAGNAVIQGTAADVFKISVARNFMYIRRNNLLGLLLITNMIHDEQLFEVNIEKLNIQRVIRDIGVNMQFKVEGFPPLFIGAGVGPNWNYAKSSMAEIHPRLLEELSAEAEEMPLFLDEPCEPEKVYEYIQGRVYEFRRKTIEEYITNPENYGKELHPVIGNLLNMQFTYGHDKRKEELKDNEFTELCLKEFIKHNNLDVDVSNFGLQEELIKDDEDVKEYDDGDDMDFDDFEIDETEFALVDESDTLYGASVQDLIRIFGFMVSKSLRVCGVDLRKLHYKQLDNLVDFLTEHACDEQDEGSMQVVFLKDGNVLNNTGIWVKGIEGSELETRLKVAN